VPGELSRAVDVARFACAELGTGRDQEGAVAAGQAADDVEIGPGLFASAPFRCAETPGIARVVVFRGEVTDDVARQWQARDDTAVLAERTLARAACCLDRGAQLVGGDRDVLGDAAETRRQGADIDRAVVAVACRRPAQRG